MSKFSKRNMIPCNWKGKKNFTSDDLYSYIVVKLLNIVYMFFESDPFLFLFHWACNIIAWNYYIWL